MTIEDIAQLCAQVFTFGCNHELFGNGSDGKAVITFEAKTFNDFAQMHCDFMRALAEHPWHGDGHHSVRTTSPASVEFTCFGVTFRLTCPVVMETPRGVMGAAELLTSPDVVFEMPATLNRRSLPHVASNSDDGS